MSKREIKIILEEILEHIKKIEKFTKNIDYKSFAKDDMRHYATLKCLEIIGEGIKQLPDDFKKKYNEIEWHKIVALRNILVHEYFGIELVIIWDIIKNKTPQLKSFIKTICKKT
ncbi:MAG: DUF86 domain-containing protein [Candidatus Hydrogenedens sp.]|nr:DUF86 domain-containing protein [Candidatus Hydrogenedens sp.]